MGEAGSILAYAAPTVEPEPETAYRARAATHEKRPCMVPGPAHGCPPATLRGGLFKQRRACYMNGCEGGPSLPTFP